MQTPSVTESRVNKHAKFLSRLDRHKPETEFYVDVSNYIKTILNELGPEEMTAQWRSLQAFDIPCQPRS